MKLADLTPVSQVRVVREAGHTHTLKWYLQLEDRGALCSEWSTSHFWASGKGYLSSK